MSWYYGTPDLVDIPGWLFAGHIRLDLESAVNADISLQNFSVVPRHFYINATFLCLECGSEFCFTAAEQKVWYETYQFYVGSFPRKCPACRRERRRLKETRKQYNESIAAALQSDDLALKQQVVSWIDDLCELDENLPAKIHENRRILSQQIERRAVL